MVVLAVVYIALIVLSVMFAKRRFNDLNRSGWWILLSLVPIVNIAVYIYMMFFRAPRAATITVPAGAQFTGRANPRLGNEWYCSCSVSSRTIAMPDHDGRRSTSSASKTAIPQFHAGLLEGRHDFLAEEFERALLLFLSQIPCWRSR